MTDHSADRTAELIAAAVANDLSTAERAELEELIRADPAIGAEVEELRATAAQLAGATPSWIEPTPPTEQLRDRVTRLSSDEPTGLAERTGRRPRRRRVPAVLAAAAAFAVGVAVTIGAQLVIDAPPSGPPGTLGAVEDVDFVGQPTAVRLDGALIAHTWGTETVLEIDGLTPGEGYLVVLVAADGAEFDSGTFFGSAVTIDCRMNAAVMREDVVRVEIRDDDGGVVAGADLPDAVAS